MSRKTCITGAHIWTGTKSGVSQGSVLISDDKIDDILIGEDAEIAVRYADEVVDASGMLVMPPFVDCHVHSSSGLLRGTENSLPLELWSYYTVSYGQGVTAEAARYAALLTGIEMIRNGIGGYIDHFGQSRFSASAMSAHLETGLRVGFAPFFADIRDEDILSMPVDDPLIDAISPRFEVDTQAIRARFEELSQDLRHNGNGRVKLMAGPNSPQRCSDELWNLWRQLRDDLGIGSHTHLLETVPQSLASRERWSRGVVHALDDYGLLDSSLSVAHAIWLSPEEKALLARRGVTASYNPISNGMLGSGRKNIRVDLDLGLNIALGTDCANTGGRNDLFEVMRHMLISGREPGSAYEDWIEPFEALTAATRSGAAALGMEGVGGTLEPGGQADVLMLDFGVGGLTVAPMNTRSVVVHADPRNVHSMMIGGAWVLRDGIVQMLDEAEVVRRASLHAENLREAAEAQVQKLARLHPSYSRWQSALMADHHSCPSCGHPKVPQTGSDE